MSALANVDRANEILIRKLREHSELDDTDVAGIRALTKNPRMFANRADLISQGDIPNSSIVVLNGMVGRYKTVGSKRQYLSYHLPGDWPDAQTLFIDRMDHSVCALGEVLVVLIPHGEILGLLDKSPNLGFAIWRETLIDAAIFREAITRIGSRPVLGRMAHFFCELYYRARASGLTKPGVCELPIHQGQLGDTLGVSIVTVNRTLQELRATRAMDFRNGNLKIIDWKKLVEIAGFDASYLNLKRPSRL